MAIAGGQGSQGDLDAAGVAANRSVAAIEYIVEAVGDFVR